MYHKKIPGIKTESLFAINNKITIIKYTRSKYFIDNTYKGNSILWNKLT